MAHINKQRQIGTHTEKQMKDALNLINRSGFSLSQAAKQSNIPFPTLRRYFNKQQLGIRRCS